MADADSGITLISVFGRSGGSDGGPGYYTNHSVNVPIRLSGLEDGGPHLSEPQSEEIMSHYQIRL